ncbi:MAG: hypothetical protein RLZZ01_2588 [Actinomycetota bacterium]
MAIRVLGAALLVVLGSSCSADPGDDRSDGTIGPVGFDRVVATAIGPDGDRCDLCLWLADSSSTRSRGLMGVTELGPADGMAFRYPTVHTGNFWMKDTLIPLSIAFYGPDGSFLDSFDMEPCTADPCPKYPTPRGFHVAVEVPAGDLGAFELVAGSELVLTDLPCDRPL